ncbi:kinase-like domain-containing protein [Limtongia smithiae]|uniref:kinase-like domain-containing protein n=1 Tax=Limtongia smithiae TaxID=1125753 RepID=UPI0034CEB850
MTTGVPTLPRAISDALDLKIISQGAEAQVYFSAVHPFIPTSLIGSTVTSNTSADNSTGYILKYRPPKPYRHAVLDAQLTRHRTLSESRILYKLFLAGVRVPSFIAVDPRQGLIWMENINGSSLKQWIWDREAEIDALVNGDQEAAALKRLKILKPVLLSVGNEIARLHFLDIVHGDLTTSNLLLQPKKSSQEEFLDPVIIDFGLASQSGLSEDKAVDLYVLERAFLSTHPLHSEEYVGWLLDGYTTGFGRGKRTAVFKVKEIMNKLEAVRLRGRKRSMVG